MTWILDTSRRTHTIRIGEDGEVLTFAQTLSQYGKVPSYMVRNRIKEGWDIEKAFTVPDVDGGWSTMSTKEKINLVYRLAAEGLDPVAIAQRIHNVHGPEIARFCNLHGIRYGQGRLRKAERPPAPVREIKPEHMSVLDPPTQPNPNGVHFLNTNNRTCRYPLWDWDATPEERMCCGAKTVGGIYCAKHGGKPSV